MTESDMWIHSELRNISSTICISRRERIATAIIGGFLSNPQWRFQPDETAKAALLFADALIKELDKED